MSQREKKEKTPPYMNGLKSITQFTLWQTHPCVCGGGGGGGEGDLNGFKHCE